MTAELHYYGYAAYASEDGKYPGQFDYEHQVIRDYAQIAGYYTRYGDVRELLEGADSRFVIMSHGDEVTLEFDAESLPELPLGWRRSFVLAAKGFYKMARPGRLHFRTGPRLNHFYLEWPVPEPRGQGPSLERR